MADLNTQASPDAGRSAARFDCLHNRFWLSIIHSRWFILGWLSQPQSEASLAQSQSISRKNNEVGSGVSRGRISAGRVWF
jgi:hypothetical protein